MKTNRALLRSIGLKFYLPARNMFLQTIIVQLFNKKIVQTDYCFFSVNINAIENVRANENFPKNNVKTDYCTIFYGPNGETSDFSSIENFLFICSKTSLIGL